MKENNSQTPLPLQTIWLGAVPGSKNVLHAAWKKAQILPEMALQDRVTLPKVFLALSLVKRKLSGHHGEEGRALSL